jgi:5-amino-6-(5-phosphoribosylamino)uracil reductase
MPGAKYIAAAAVARPGGAAGSRRLPGRGTAVSIVTASRGPAQRMASQPTAWQRGPGPAARGKFWLVAQLPYVLLSAAMSADGYIDDSTGTRLILSDAADLDRVDELRAGSDAILVGAQTIRTDNPRLLVRSAARRAARRERGLAQNPVKVTLTRSGSLDPAARFFTEADTPPLVYVAATAAGQVAGRLAGGATVVAAPAPGELDVAWMMADLAGRGIGRLLVEGGSAVLGQFLSAGLADELILAVAPVFVADPRAPRLIAGPGTAGRMRLAGVSQAGDMAVLTYWPAKRGDQQVTAAEK